MRTRMSTAIVAAASVTCTLLMLLASPLAADAQQFSDWSAPVNVGTPVNIAGFATMNPFISKNGLSLYFACINCPGGIGRSDVWVSQRASVNDPWGPPQNLGPNINTSSGEGGPTLSPDEHSLYFASDRSGGFSGNDLWVSRRHNRRDDFAWQPAVNLGSGVNTAANDAAPTIFEDDVNGIITLYFGSNRPGGLGGNDIYASTLQPDGTFGPAELVVELSSASDDNTPAVRRDGLEIFLQSNRAGSIPPEGFPDQVTDLWVSTRGSTSEPWSAPVNLGPVVNSGFIDGGPALSRDGTTLYFHSPFRPGNVTDHFNIWVTTRTKLKGPHHEEDKEEDCKEKN